MWRRVGARCGFAFLRHLQHMTAGLSVDLHPPPADCPVAARVPREADSSAASSFPGSRQGLIKILTSPVLPVTAPSRNRTKRSTLKIRSDCETTPPPLFEPRTQRPCRNDSLREICKPSFRLGYVVTSEACLSPHDIRMLTGLLWQFNAKQARREAQKAAKQDNELKKQIQTVGRSLPLLHR